MLTGNTFDPNNDIPDLSGKVYVVTGGSAGIGYGISAHILQHNPQKLYLLGKKQHHLDEAAAGARLARDGPGQDHGAPGVLGRQGRASGGVREGGRGWRGLRIAELTRLALLRPRTGRGS